MRRRGVAVVLIGCALGLAAVASGAPAAARPRDVLTKMRLEAARKEYVAGHADAAAKKLEEAQKQCEPDWCSSAVKVDVLRELAIVRVGGQKRHDDAVKLFAAALVIDPKLSLPATLATKDVEAAFDQAKAQLSAKASASVAAAAAASAPPPPPPPPAPEPRPVSSIGAVKWVPNVGFTQEASGVIPAIAARPTTPITLEKPTDLDSSRTRIYAGSGKAELAPNVKGFQPCDPLEVPGVAIGLDGDFHTAGTLVGHRLIFDSFVGFNGEPKVPCSNLQKASVNTMSLGYGLDFHLPLPGVLSGLSLGPFGMARFDTYRASATAPSSGPFSSGSSADDSSGTDFGGRWGGHVRWRLGRPERGAHLTLDVARTSRWAPKHRSDYLQYQAALGYRWFGVYVSIEQRFRSVGGDPGVRDFGSLYAKNNAIKSVSSAGLSLSF